MDHRYCTECGHRLAVESAFCTECGTALGPLPAAADVTLRTPPAVPAPPPPTVPVVSPPPPPAQIPAPPAMPRPAGGPVAAGMAPPPPSDTDSRQWLGRALLITAVAVLLGVLGIGGAVVLLSGDDEPVASGEARADAGTEQVPDTTAPSSPTGSTPDASPDVVPSATPEPSGTTEPSSPTRVCWDGSLPPGCTAPTGPPGLRYLLPDFDLAAEGCPSVPTRIGGQSRFRYDCDYTGTSDPVRYGFSEFDTFGKAYGYHNKLSGVRPRRIGDFQRWDYIATTGEYKTALVYAGKTWGVTVYSYSAAQRDDAVLALIRAFRPAVEFKGYRA